MVGATGAGDLYLYVPGDAVGVDVVADSSGNVATRGEGVELSGENDAVVEVALVGTAGNGLGFLSRNPDTFDPNATYSAGETVGRSEVELWKPVALLPVDSAYTPALGDLVQWSSGGDVEAYNSTNVPDPYGRVFRTIGEPEAPDKIAVAIQR